MSFRERSAWISFVTVLACFGVYFGAVLTHSVPRGLPTVLLFAACVAGLAALQALLTVISALRAPNEAKAPRDERERLIDGRARTVGYYVLLVGVLGLAIPGHTGGGVVDMLNFALAAIVVAELTVSAVQIILHRRGA